MNKPLSWVLLAALALPCAAIAAFLPGVLAPAERRDLVAAQEGQTEQQLAQALKQLTSDEISVLEARERAAFSARPLDTAALVNLTVLAGLQGDKEKEQRLALALSDYARRSVRSQLPAVQIFLDRKDYVNALDRIDGVLRARGDLSAQFFPLLSGLIADDGARTQLALTLKADPPWRWDYLRHVTSLPDQGARAYQLLSEMRRQSSPVSDYEKRLLLSRMLSEKLFDSAYFMWLDLLQPADLARVRNVFDGGFSTTPRQHFFDWNTPARKNARISVVRRPGNSQDQSLELDLAGDSEGGLFVFQLLRLSPGPFTASFEHQITDLKNPAGLVWRVMCVESGAFLGESPVLNENGPWNKTSFRFAVPEEGCATQNLSLQLKSSAALDALTSGRMLFDNMEVSSGTAENSSGLSQDAGEGGQQQ